MYQDRSPFRAGEYRSPFRSLEPSILRGSSPASSLLTHSGAESYALPTWTPRRPGAPSPTHADSASGPGGGTPSDQLAAVMQQLTRERREYERQLHAAHTQRAQSEARANLLQARCAAAEDELAAVRTRLRQAEDALARERTAHAATLARLKREAVMSAQQRGSGEPGRLATPLLQSAAQRLQECEMLLARVCDTVVLSPAHRSGDGMGIASTATVSSARPHGNAASDSVVTPTVSATDQTSRARTVSPLRPDVIPAAAIGTLISAQNTDDRLIGDIGSKSSHDRVGAVAQPIRPSPAGAESVGARTPGDTDVIQLVLQMLNDGERGTRAAQAKTHADVAGVSGESGTYAAVGSALRQTASGASETVTDGSTGADS